MIVYIIRRLPVPEFYIFAVAVGTPNTYLCCPHFCGRTAVLFIFDFTMVINDGTGMGWGSRGGILEVWSSAAMPIKCLVRRVQGLLNCCSRSDLFVFTCEVFFFERSLFHNNCAARQTRRGIAHAYLYMRLRDVVSSILTFRTCVAIAVLE